MPPEYPDTIDRLRATDPSLATELAGFHGIDNVLTWMAQHGLSRAPIDMIAQDEFEYDFLIEIEPAGRWLAFGVT